MSAATETPDSVASVADVTKPAAVAVVSVGDCLRRAREARGDSLADAAQALRIGVRQVEAMEHDDWSALPGTPFVRGFVRNYARWLGQDGDALVAQIETADLPDSPTLDLRAATTASLPQGHAMPRRDFATLGLAVAVIVLAVLAYLFVPDDFWALPGSMSAPARAPASTEPTAPAPAAPAPVAVVAPAANILPAGGGEPATAAAATQPATAPGEAMPSAGAGAPPAAAAAATAGAPATPAAPVAAGGVVPAPVAPTAAASAPAAPAPSIELRFDGRAWAEIRDHQGTLVFSDTVEAGESRAVAGKAPFLVVIGKADAVRLRYKGKSVDLAPHVRRNVARLTLE